VSCHRDQGCGHNFYKVTEDWDEEDTGKVAKFTRVTKTGQEVSCEKTVSSLQNAIYLFHVWENLWQSLLLWLNLTCFFLVGRIKTKLSLNGV